MEVFMRRLLLSGLMVLAFSVTAFAGVDVSKLQLPGDITQAQADTVRVKGGGCRGVRQANRREGMFRSSI